MQKDELLSKEQLLQGVFSQLRPYQQEVVKRMYTEKGHLNYMDMGMGKSLATSFAIMYAEAFPCIIVCTKSAMGVWQEELMKWYGEEGVIYAGKPKQRDKVWKDFCARGLKFIITNYALAEELGQRFGLVSVTPRKGSNDSGTKKAKQPTTPGTKWHVGGIIADEIQRGGLFNHKTKTYVVFKKLCKDIGFRFLLTGTPYRRGVIDFFGPLSLVAPEEFDSYWKYVGNWCLSINTGFGKGIERNPKDVVAFREMIRRHASIMKKEDYLHELPGKVRQPIPIDMDDEQARVYNELTEEMYAETDNGELIMTPSILALSVRQRQLLAAPQDLGLNTRGAAIDTMIEMAGDLVEQNRPFVIFTPFKKAVPWIESALKEEFGHIRIFTITGGLSADEFTAQWQGFQNFSGSTPSVLICVILSGASFHATRADTAFFLGYEWDFNANTQAEDRLNRMGQKKLVTCYYLMHRGTIDDAVKQRLNDKQYGANLVLSNEEVFSAMLKRRES